MARGQTRLTKYSTSAEHVCGGLRLFINPLTAFYIRDMSWRKSLTNKCTSTQLWLPLRRKWYDNRNKGNLYKFKQLSDLAWKTVLLWEYNDESFLVQAYFAFVGAAPRLMRNQKVVLPRQLFLALSGACLEKITVLIPLFCLKDHFVFLILCFLMCVYWKSSTKA